MEPIDPSPSSAAPGEADLLARLRPGAWSTSGFLGADESLHDVLAHDAATMARLGLSYDELADSLDKLMTTVLEMYRKPVPEEEIPRVLARQTNFPNLSHPETIPHFDLQHLPDIQLGFIIDHLQVFVVSYKGWKECPWGDATKGQSEFMIVNRETGESVTAPELMPHLIHAHHFFGGLGTPYRTDPEQLARVLGLVER